MTERDDLTWPEALNLVLVVLPKLEARLRGYAQARQALVGLPPSFAGEDERAALEKFVAQAERDCAPLRELPRHLKLDPGRRHKSPAQWAIVRQIAADLALFLSKRMSPRRPAYVRSGMYKAEPIRLTAELMNLAYADIVPGLKMTPQAVKNSITARRHRLA